MIASHLTTRVDKRLQINKMTAEQEHILSWLLTIKQYSSHTCVHPESIEASEPFDTQSTLEMSFAYSQFDSIRHRNVFT
jgi:hypothetical protein